MAGCCALLKAGPSRGLLPPAASGKSALQARPKQAACPSGPQAFEKQEDARDGTGLLSHPPSLSLPCSLSVPSHAGQLPQGNSGPGPPLLLAPPQPSGLGPPLPISDLEVEARTPTALGTSPQAEEGLILPGWLGYRGSSVLCRIHCSERYQAGQWYTEDTEGNCLHVQTSLASGDDISLIPEGSLTSFPVHPSLS